MEIDNDIEEPGFACADHHQQTILRSSRVSAHMGGSRFKAKRIVTGRNAPPLIQDRQLLRIHCDLNSQSQNRIMDQYFPFL